MGIEHVRWHHHWREFRWGFFVGPFSTPLYMCGAVLISAFLSAATDINALILAVAAIAMVLIIQPKKRLLKIKNRAG